MIIFPNTPLHIAGKVAERIRQAIEDYSFIDGLRITISGGVCQYNNEMITELIHSADTKLYTAKGKGKNQTLSEK